MEKKKRNTFENPAMAAAYFVHGNAMTGARDKGGDLESISEDLRIREFPEPTV